MRSETTSVQPRSPFQIEVYSGEIYFTMNPEGYEKARIDFPRDFQDDIFDEVIGSKEEKYFLGSRNGLVKFNIPEGAMWLREVPKNIVGYLEKVTETRFIHLLSSKNKIVERSS